MMTPGQFIVGTVFCVLILVTGEILGEIKAKEQIINTLLDRIPKDEDLKRKLEELKRLENSVL